MQSALTPWPLQVLLGRVAREWETRHRIFDLPSGKFHHVDPTTDLGIAVMGQAVATSIGPAAGPHTQLAQNIVAGWLAGARIFELKTVQVRDDLDIPRPCIDVAGVGYNVEWSQELRIQQSLDEYVKAWMALAILGAWEPLRPVLGAPGAHLFDMSVGYDLAGIKTPAMAGFISGLLDASPIIDRLRPLLPEPFAAWRERTIPSRIVTSVTLSTFHGCPPDEIEAIARHLMTEYGLDVVIKLNPTLLGIDAVSGILSRLGHDEVVLDPDAFAADLQYERAIEMVHSLHGFAAAQRRTVGIKLTNTLVVRNHLGRLPGDAMYLSGPPLHVIAVTLLDRLVGDLDGMLGIGPEPGPVPVSFSGGIDRGNVTHAVGLGMAPVTMCTALLKPGGYGNLSGMLNVLGREMHEAGCPTVADLVQSRHEAARRDGHRDAVAAYAATLGGESGVRSFGRAATTPRLREVDRDLETWDCVSCNLCVTVCPNDAMLHLASPQGLGFEEKWQYFCLAEWCNDCGNCTPFCPEFGDPSRVKPRLFLDREAFEADGGPGYLISVGAGGFELESRDPADPRDPAKVLAVLAGPEGLPLRAGDLS
jgi:putative selenate reductase